MKYNLADKAENQKAIDYFTKLMLSNSLVEIKKINPRRSLSQNSYLHLALGLFALESGHTLAEAKTIYKRDVNPEIYVYEKGGSIFLRSSADLDSKEMTITIDRFRTFAAELDILIPPPTNEAELRSLYNTLEAKQYYL